MRRLLATALTAATLLCLTGCSGFFQKSGRVFTFSQHERGNVAASDSVGTNLSARSMQTASVPADQ